MQDRVVRVTLTSAITAGALIFGGCGTTGGRISQHPEMYQRLSPRDQALVSEGQIRPGMTMDAVWLAWGTPDQKIPNNMDGRPTETWVTCVMTHLQATADRTITDRSIGHIFHQSSFTREEASPSP